MGGVERKISCGHFWKQREFINSKCSASQTQYAITVWEETTKSITKVLENVQAIIFLRLKIETATKLQNGSFTIFYMSL